MAASSLLRSLTRHARRGCAGSGPFSHHPWSPFSTTAAAGARDEAGKGFPGLGPTTKVEKVRVVVLEMGWAARSHPARSVQVGRLLLPPRHLHRHRPRRPHGEILPIFRPRSPLMRNQLSLTPADEEFCPDLPKVLIGKCRANKKLMKDAQLLFNGFKTRTIH